MAATFDFCSFAHGAVSAVVQSCGLTSKTWVAYSRWNFVAVAYRSWDTFNYVFQPPSQISGFQFHQAVFLMVALESLFNEIDKGPNGPLTRQ
jgi:hypothetical protein